MEQNNQLNNDPNSPDKVFELYRLVKERISKALAVFNRHPCDETIYGVMDEILFGYMFNVSCFVPAYLDKLNRGFIFKTAYCKERRGEAYVLYTDINEAKKTGEIILVMSYRNAIRKAASCKDLVGIYINPAQDRPQLFMTKQNMDVIVRTGEDEISGLSDEFRESLEKYPDAKPEDLKRCPGNQQLLQ